MSPYLLYVLTCCRRGPIPDDVLHHWASMWSRYPHPYSSRRGTP